MWGNKLMKKVTANNNTYTYWPVRLITTGLPQKPGARPIDVTPRVLVLEQKFDPQSLSTMLAHELRGAQHRSVWWISQLKAYALSSGEHLLIYSANPSLSDKKFTSWQRFETGIPGHFWRSGNFLDILDVSSRLELATRVLGAGTYPRRSAYGFASSGMAFFQFRLNIVSFAPNHTVKF